MKVYETAEDGYNLHAMYKKCSDFLDSEGDDHGDLKGYHYNIILVKTKTNAVFGSFVTAFPAYNAKTRFLGTHESFVFYVDNETVQVFTTEEEENNYYMSCDYKNLSIGSGGDGPAIIINDELHKGFTNSCETFGSPILVKDGKKH